VRFILFREDDPKHLVLEDLSPLDCLLVFYICMFAGSFGVYTLCMFGVLAFLAYFICLTFVTLEVLHFFCDWKSPINEERETT